MNPSAAPALVEDRTLLTPPGEATAPRQRSFLWLLLPLLVLSLVVAHRLRRRRRSAELISPPEPPASTARRELAAWATLTDPAQFRRAVLAISGTVRRYSAARFGVAAPTLTTEQFWTELRTRRKIPAEHDVFWMSFLTACDEITYAGRTPAPAQFAALLRAAEKFVAATATET